MNRYATRRREDISRYLEDDGSRGFTETRPRENDWSTRRVERDRRVISSPKLEKNNSFQTYSSRTRVKDSQLNLLRPADHIGWRRHYGIWHHALVTDIDTTDTTLKVVHYTKVRGKARVSEQWIDAKKEKGDLFRFDYPKSITDANPPDLVLERARKRIGEESYNLFSNNCEHFATSCKTGTERSYQVKWAGKKLIETVHTGAANYTRLVVKEVGKQTCKEISARAGKVAAAETIEHINKASNWGGAGLMAAIEVGHCAYDIHRMYQNKKDGKISDRDFKISSTQRVTEGVIGGGSAIGGSVLGGYIGGAIGSFIPGAGTAVGAFVGSLIGGVGGSIIGKAFGTLFGGWLGRRLW